MRGGGDWHWLLLVSVYYIHTSQKNPRTRTNTIKQHPHAHNKIAHVHTDRGPSRRALDQHHLALQREKPDRNGD